MLWYSEKPSKCSTLQRRQRLMDAKISDCHIQLNSLYKQVSAVHSGTSVKKIKIAHHKRKICRRLQSAVFICSHTAICIPSKPKLGTSQSTTCEDILSLSSCFSACQDISGTWARCANCEATQQSPCHRLSPPVEFGAVRTNSTPKFCSTQPRTPSWNEDHAPFPAVFQIFSRN